MKPIGPLMREHRLIERMIVLLAREIKRIDEDKAANVVFLLGAVDFIRMYADRTHHGKEEFILFKALAEKPLTDEHRTTMNALIQEHVSGREIVTRLADAEERYQKGDTGALGEIVTDLKALIAFYPTHIKKEDEHFFYPILEYLSKAEQDKMLDEYWEFDRSLIHEKYGKVVEKYEKEL